MDQEVDTWICPDCGAEVKVGARGCPGCGPARRKRPRRARARRKRRAWEQDSSHDGLDLPDDDFDYDDFIAREFGGRRGKAGVAWYWWLTALLLAAGLVALLLAGLW